MHGCNLPVLVKERDPSVSKVGCVWEVLCVSGKRGKILYESYIRSGGCLAGCCVSGKTENILCESYLGSGVFGRFLCVSGTRGKILCESYLPGVVCIWHVDMYLLMQRGTSSRKPDEVCLAKLSRTTTKKKFGHCQCCLRMALGLRTRVRYRLVQSRTRSTGWSPSGRWLKYLRVGEVRASRACEPLNDHCVIVVWILIPRKHNTDTQTVTQTHRHTDTQTQTDTGTDTDTYADAYMDTHNHTHT
jgi:hypothetical protein